MMFIKDGNKRHEWHVGEPFPFIEGKVVTIQADGDELELLKKALQSKVVGITKRLK